MCQKSYNKQISSNFETKKCAKLPTNYAQNSSKVHFTAIICYTKVSKSQTEGVKKDWDQL